MAEDTRPDADFSESAPQETVESMTPVADALKESIEARFTKVAGNEIRGDKIPDILRSVEKSMFLQTEFLGRISTSLDKQLSFNKEALEDRDRLENLGSVSEEDAPTPPPDDKSLMDKIKDKAIGAKNKARDTLIGAEDDSAMKKIAKTMTTAVVGGLFVSGFVGQAAKDGFRRVGLSDERSDAMGESVGNATGIGTTAAVLASSLKFFTGKGPGGLKAFASTAVAKLTYDALGSLDIDEDGKILGMKTELVQAVGGGLAGIATFIGVGKSFRLLSKGLKKSFNFAKSKLGGGPKVPKVDIPKPTTSSTKAITNVAKTASKGLTATATTATQAIPSGVNINTSGVANQGRPSTIKGVAESLKNTNPSKIAKYAKFFKFAGPAAAVLPALIDPAMAIYNDAPDDVVRKEIAGALGSVGGATLGSIAGTSVGGVLGLGAAGVGAIPGGIIGGFIGGIGGAFAGEWLLEKMTDALMGGPEINPEDMNKINEEATPKSDAPSVSANVSAKITDADMGPTSEQKVADAQVKADDAGKALENFKSTAGSSKAVTTDYNGFEYDETVFDDPAEQAQFVKLMDAKNDADYAVQDATSEMITGDSFNVPGIFEKLQFLQDKGLVDGNNTIKMGKFVGGPLSGMTPDEAIEMYVTQNSSTSKAAAEFKAGDRPIPTIAPDMTKPVTADGKIPAKVTPAATGGFANATATGDDMGLSVEEAEKQLTDAKVAFAQAEEDGSIYEGTRQDQLQADIQFAEKDLRDANTRAAANGDFVKRKPEVPKNIMETSGIQSAPEKLMNKTKAISDEKATQDSQGKAVMMNNLTQGGANITSNNVGGNKTDVHVHNGSGSGSLANAHLPVPQGA